MTTSGSEPQDPFGPPVPSYPPPAYPQAAPPQYPPQYGQPQYGQPQYGQPQYGQPQYGQPAYPPQYGPPPTRPDLSGGARAVGWILVGLAVITVISAFLPWANFLGYSLNGIGNDQFRGGVFTLFLGVIVGGFGLARALVRKTGGIHLAVGIVSVILGLLISVVALANIGDVGKYRDFGGTGIHVGAGLVLTLIAGIGILAVGIVGIVKRT